VHAVRTVKTWGYRISKIFASATALKMGKYMTDIAKHLASPMQ